MILGFTKIWVLVCVLSMTCTQAFADDSIMVRVEKGESLIQLCQRYLEQPGKWKRIAQINQLTNPHYIYPGQYLVFPIALLKGDPIKGRVSFIKGVAEVYDEEDERWLPLTISDTVIVGDKIRTHSGSSLEITYQNDISILLREKTELEISRTLAKRENNIIYDFILSIGRAVSYLKKATGKDIRYKITTPSAVAAARGTVFRVSTDSTAATRLEVLQGEISAKADIEETRIQSGYGALVTQDATTIEQTKLLPPPGLLDIQPLYTTTPITVSVLAAPGTVSMRLLLARDSTLREIVTEQYITPQQTLEIGGVDEGVYFLAGSSVDAYGLEGSFSDPVQLRLKKPPPTAPEPEHDETDREKIGFRWANQGGGNTYHFQFSDNIDFSTIRVELETPKSQITIPKPERSGTYYYRVQVVDIDGISGPFSEPKTLITQDKYTGFPGIVAAALVIAIIFL